MGHGDMYCVNEREPIVLYVQLKIYVRLDLKIANTCTYLLHNLRFIRVWGGGENDRKRSTLCIFFFGIEDDEKKKRLLRALLLGFFIVQKKLYYFFFYLIKLANPENKHENPTSKRRIYFAQTISTRKLFYST